MSIEVVALGELAGSEDVPDPHRMPLGVWIAALQTYLTQIGVALPQIRARSGAGGGPHRPEGTRPLSGAERGFNAPTNTDAPHMDQDLNVSPPGRGEGQGVGSPSRAEHLNRIARLIDTAETLPEIVDWPTRRRRGCGRWPGW